MLANNREPLGISGEHTLVVAPLAVPVEERVDALGDGRDCAAATLFAERAAAAPGFIVTADNRRAVASLCRRLDELPLAIELTAVRIRALPVDQILAQLLMFSLVLWLLGVDCQSGVGEEGPGELVVGADAVDAV
ncbi:hypothetical protein ACFYZR_28465, partial [Streptomyces sp. NPDC001678]